MKLDIPYADDVAPAGPIVKPIKGTKLVESKERRAERVAAEQKVMRAAKKRDEYQCRVPRCEFASMKLDLDPAHFKHRQMGGNPKGDRTTLDNLVTLCRAHHGRFDACVLDIEPQTAEGGNGACAFYEKDAETGRMVCLGVESVIGVSAERRAS